MTSRSTAPERQYRRHRPRWSLPRSNTTTPRALASAGRRSSPSPAARPRMRRSSRPWPGPRGDRHSEWRGIFAVTGLTDGVQTTNISVVDSGTPQLQQIATITCPTGAPPPALTVNPQSYSYTGAAACSGSTSNFVITGGTPPYTAFFSVAGTVGVINPTNIPASGQGFSVTGLAPAPLPRTTQITVRTPTRAPRQISRDG